MAYRSHMYSPHTHVYIYRDDDDVMTTAAAISACLLPVVCVVLLLMKIMMLCMALLVMQVMHVVPHTPTNEEMFSLLHVNMYIYIYIYSYTMQFMQEDLPPIVRRFHHPLCFVLLNSPGGCRIGRSRNSRCSRTSMLQQIFPHMAYGWQAR